MDSKGTIWHHSAWKQVAKTLHLKFKNIGVNPTTFIKKDRMRLNKKNRMRIYFRQPSNKLAEIVSKLQSQVAYIDEVHRQKNEGRHKIMRIRRSIVKANT